MRNANRQRHRSKLPAFLGLGPEKTASGWLYGALAKHLRLYLTPVKEIRYFYERCVYPNERLVDRLSSTGDWHSAEYRTYLVERLNSLRSRPWTLLTDWRRTAWDARFILGHRTDKWYASLFDDAKAGSLSCDIDPLYFSVPPDEVPRIRALLPESKALIVLREPVSWLWSFARMSLLRSRTLEDVSHEEFESFFNEYVEYYPSTERLSPWIGAFGGDLRISFYDDILLDPLAFVDGICEFLSLERLSVVRPDADVTLRVNRGAAIDLPPRIRTYLEKITFGITVDIAAEFGGAASCWLAARENPQQIVPCDPAPKKWTVLNVSSPEPD